jgi:chromosome partitioning protein
MIIAITGFKGGCGKTTVCVNLAACVQEIGHTVLVIDSDPQASALAWKSAATDQNFPPVFGLPKPILHRPEQVPRLAQMYDSVFIDCPPADTDIIRSALMTAEIAIVPVTPSPLDIWSATSFVRLLSDARTINTNLTAWLLIVRRKPQTVLGEEGRSALEPYNLPILDTEIFERIDNQKAVVAGTTINRYDPTSKAALEFQALAKEIMDYAEKKVASASRHHSSKPRR